ncbi:hypothetical protein TRVL_00578 [Trypanosoma vivax]|nr:hypothetical protein TRVL_00578 [Trypanosoma vivax]
MLLLLYHNLIAIGLVHTLPGTHSEDALRSRWWLHYDQEARSLPPSGNRVMFDGLREWREKTTASTKQEKRRQQEDKYIQERKRMGCKVIIGAKVSCSDLSSCCTY